uniref:Rab-GAP TBC domain-containing protein n=1 Tax=Araucaria cunninghamii TaxID=56994 RepID=A0A0D6QVQ7_ARACU
MPKSLVQANANGNGEGSSVSPRSCGSGSGCSDREREWSVESSESGIASLRSVQWRVNLGVLPSNTSSIDDLRRAAANGRRMYAELRRRLLVDPHIMEESQKDADLSMENPLSQNPESVWGRFFRNAELERTIDNDLSRLYPEHGSYFQTTSCQAMLRRILLLRALRYPEHSYRQGMHELLAPLLYVLHVDVMHLSQVKHLYEDLFDDRFEDLSFQKSNSNFSENLEKQKKNKFVYGRTLTKAEDEDKALDGSSSIDSVGSDELDTDVMSVILSSDAYGAEGELGALLSARFMEHDAYCMFDALLSGQGGAVAMADYFMNSPPIGSLAGLPPVLEASVDLYNLLSVADFSLYSHLVELGVEPQYFALRWLRVLFSREFGLEDLLVVWDAILETSNAPLPFCGDNILGNSVPYSARSAFISAMSVSLLLHLRSALLATTNATICLQKLLNFPKNADVKKLIRKAKLLQSLALDTNATTPPPMGKIGRNFDNARTGKLVRSVSASCSYQIPALPHKAAVLQHHRSIPCSQDGLRVSMPDSYWEEKWRNSMLQKVVPEESLDQGIECLGKALPGQTYGKSPKDASCQEHSLSNSANCPEVQETGKENCLVLLNAIQDSLSDSMDTKDRNETSSIRSARRKLLDSKIESSDIQSELNANKFCFIEGNGANVADQNHCNQNYSVHPNGGHLVDSVHEKGTNGNQLLEEPKTDNMICIDSVKNFSNGNVSDQGNKCLSKLSFDKEIKQETSVSSSCLSEPISTNSNVDKISTPDKNRMDAVNMEVKELPKSSEACNIRSCPELPSQVSREGTCEEPPGKAVTSGSSEIAETSDAMRKQKPSGKFRWIWNFMKKDNGELSKTRAEDSIGSDGKRGLSEKTIISQGKQGNSVSSLPILHENDIGNSLCASENDGDQSLHSCNNDGDQCSCACENDGDQLLCASENQSDQPLQIHESDKNQLSHVCENDGDQPLCICENNRNQPCCVHKKAGDELSCSSDIQNGSTTNCEVSQPILDNSEVSELLNDNNPSTNLRNLGQSMLQNIQVIESTFLQSCTAPNKSETQTASVERVEHSSKSLAGKGQHAALIALAELRKISNILSQM